MPPNLHDLLAITLCAHPTKISERSIQSVKLWYKVLDYSYCRNIQISDDSSSCLIDHFSHHVYFMTHKFKYMYATIMNFGFQFSQKNGLFDGNNWKSVRWYFIEL